MGDKYPILEQRFLNKNISKDVNGDAVYTEKSKNVKAMIRNTEQKMSKSQIFAYLSKRRIVR